MKSDEIDKIIADAVAESKKQSKWHRPSRGNTPGMIKLRNILNALFMAGFIATVTIYFVMPENREYFFYVGFGTMLIKCIEFFIRFVL